jgi:MFS transporter, DHA2 family, multidrug resistance protein
VALNAGVFATFVLGAELLPAKPMRSVMVFAASVSLFIVLLRREAAKKVPLIPLDLLRHASFRTSVIASVLCFSGVAAGIVALPFQLQRGLGLSAWMTGLYMTLWPLTVAIAAPLAGRIVNKISTAWLCAAGGSLIAIGLAAVALLSSLKGHSLQLVLLTMLSGLGFGLFQVPNNRNMFLAAPRERSAAAGGMQGTARLTGQTIGALIMTLLFTTTGIDAAPRLGLVIAALSTLAAGFTSILRARTIATDGVGAPAQVTNEP